MVIPYGVTNHPLSQLIPNATVMIMALGICTLQFSMSTFRLWQVLFDAGIAFKVIVAANLSFSLFQWIRTFFLMPLGNGLTILLFCYKSEYHPIKAWVDPASAPFYSSPYSRRSLWPTADIKDRKQKQKSVESISVVKIIVTSDFILFLIWVAIGNLDCIFANFSFAQFSQYVQEDYKGLLIRSFIMKNLYKTI